MQFMELKDMLETHGQAHLLRWWNELDAAERVCLADEIAQIDWETVALWNAPSQGKAKGAIAPIAGLALADIAARRASYCETGVCAIRAGKAAAVMLAGGQGTRLGSHAPKGAYDIGITKPLYIFEQLVRNLRDVAESCGAEIPLYIMTSEENDAATRAFFVEHAFFGYPARAVRFFRQGMGVCVGTDGKILMAGKGRLARSPNGNGGWYASLVRAGLAREAEVQGVEWFNVFAVDNVLQRICDPVFLGATIESGLATGAKVVRKAYPEERVGVMCLEDGRPGVIEYYELSEEMANLRAADGSLVYGQGTILNYLFRADMLKQTVSERLPVHVAHKKVPYFGEDGVLHEPQTENGCKFETLILDMIRCAGSCLPFEVEREREFAPIKNRTGVDSVETARALLQKNGVEL